MDVLEYAGCGGLFALETGTASEALKKSIDLNKPGGTIDFFFLAMTRWHQGKPEEARELFAKGATYLKHNPGDHELGGFRREAEMLLKIPSSNCIRRGIRRPGRRMKSALQRRDPGSLSAGSVQASVKNPAITTPRANAMSLERRCRSSPNPAAWALAGHCSDSSNREGEATVDHNVCAGIERVGIDQNGGMMT